MDKYHDDTDRQKQEQDERQQWEEHEKQLRELEGLLGEETVINRRWDFIFKELQDAKERTD